MSKLDTIKMLTHIKDTLGNLINTNTITQKSINILFDKIETIEKDIHELKKSFTETII